MKNSKRIYYILSTITLCVILISLQSCEPDDRTVLPEISSSGGRHFGMLVDNTVWVPKSQPLNAFQTSGGGVQAVKSRSNGSVDTLYIQISASITDKTPPEYIDIIFVIDKHTLEIMSPVNPFYRVFCRGLSGDSTEYSTSKEPSDYMSIIELNEEERYISGTFDFDHVVNVNGDSIMLTEGRFDIDYTN